MQTSRAQRVNQGLYDSGWLASSVAFISVVTISELRQALGISIPLPILSTLLAVSLLLSVCYAGYVASVKAVLAFALLSTLYFAYYLVQSSSTSETFEESLTMAMAAGVSFLVTGGAISWLQQDNRKLVDRERQAALQAKAEQLRLAAIIEQLPVGVVVADAISGKTLYSNQEIVNLTGRPFNQNHPHFYAKKRAYSPDKKPIPPNQWPLARVLRGEIVNQEQLLYRRDDSTYVPISINGTPIYDQLGRQIAGVVIVSDMSRNKEAELRKDEFLDIASHELKSPVTSLKVYSQILAKQLGRHKNIRTRQILTKMDAQLDKLTHLANDLLDIRRIQLGKLTYRIAPFDANVMVQDIVDGLDHNSHIITVEGQLSKPILGDQERIGQVVINLLTNAFKYSPEKSQVIIRLAEEGDQAVLSVQDFGIGINSADQTKVFSQFFQVNSTQPTSPGLGIGLYLAAQIIHHHHGKIWMDSQIGKGSTFYISLPLGLDEQPTA